MDRPPNPLLEADANGKGPSGLGAQRPAPPAVRGPFPTALVCSTLMGVPLGLPHAQAPPAPPQRLGEAPLLTPPPAGPSPQAQPSPLPGGQTHPQAPGPRLTPGIICHGACAPLGVGAVPSSTRGLRRASVSICRSKGHSCPEKLCPGPAQPSSVGARGAGVDIFTYTRTHQNAPTRPPPSGLRGILPWGWGSGVRQRRAGLALGVPGPPLQGEGGGPHGGAGWRPVPVLTRQRQSVPRKTETMQ